MIQVSSNGNTLACIPKKSPYFGSQALKATSRACFDTEQALKLSWIPLNSSSVYLVIYTFVIENSKYPSSKTVTPIFRNFESPNRSFRKITIISKKHIKHMFSAKKHIFFTKHIEKYIFFSKKYIKHIKHIEKYMDFSEKSEKRSHFWQEKKLPSRPV